MERDAYLFLKKWKSKSNRKPLIIQGARQVGKTWLMKEFGKNEYPDMAYFNFETTPELSLIFKSGYDIPKIILSLEIILGRKIHATTTLIVLDEIQVCPDAITSLKYFHENAPQYHVFAAGSLLGVAIHKGVSFPVGKVDFYTLNPLTFNEFLKATNNESIVEAIESANFQLLEPFHEILIEHLKKYMIIGGMPAAVLEYVQNGDFIEIRDIQNQIIQAYELDFSKHAPIEQLPRIRLIWNSIVGQLAKENSKFIYSVLRTGARAKEFELAIQWLIDAGLIHKVVRIKKAGIPITAFAEWSDFKIYLSDVGLLGAMAQVSAKTILNGNQIFEEFKGIMSEQYICQSIISQKIHPFYWSPEGGTSEVDFVIQVNEQIIPIEVKSSENLKSRSLRVYFDKYQPKTCVRTSLAKSIKQDWMENIPLPLFHGWILNIQDESHH